MMPWYYGGANWWMLLVGGIVMLLFWIGVIVLAVLAIRAIVRATGSSHPGAGSVSRSNQNALDILNERYARGEINRDEYTAMKKDLEG